MNTDEKQEELTLQLLHSIEGESHISQRSLAARLGVALGVTNAYLKRCIHKGLIKVEQAPANRYLYYLTPQGFSEKSRLTACYLKSSLKFYRHASLACANTLNQCRRDGFQSIVLCGASELAEIFLLWAREIPMAVAGIYDPHFSKPHFMSCDVRKNLELFSTNTAYIITELNQPERLLTTLLKEINSKKIYLPDVLKLSK